LNFFELITFNSSLKDTKQKAGNARVINLFQFLIKGYGISCLLAVQKRDLSIPH